MKIYTGFGDKGDTALFGGETVKKNHLRVEMYGILDELNSHVGLLRQSNNDVRTDTILENIQHELFTYGSEIATPDEERRAKFSEQISAVHIVALEKAIDGYSEKLPELKHFVLPGGTTAACHAHIARTVCRRAERTLVSLSHETEIRDELIVYLNRLSDLLFVIARYENILNKINDVPWQGIRKE